MRTILVGECRDDSLYRLSDPDAPNETALEHWVARALSCVYSNFRCIVFGGGFRHEGRVRRPDLALISNDYSHWFIIEVELVSHSLFDHVLPQATAFRYGTPEPDCTMILSRELGVTVERAKTLIDHIPRTVAVVANKRDFKWQMALDAHNIQFLAVSEFRSNNGIEALEVDGTLEVLQESLGFGKYSAVDRSLRFPRLCKIPIGTVQLNDPTGTFSLWTVSRDDRYTWVTKEVGVPDIPHDSFIQIIRTVGGNLSLRRPL